VNYAEESLKKHYEWQGKIEMVSRVPVNTREDLSLAYTPGVAEPCLAIHRNPADSFLLTIRSNLVAVITDGSAVLGLGDIGPEAAMPVMEGKCVLFKELGGVDAIPLCINSRDTDEIVNTIRLLAGSFGGINLEDIAAPRCFEIEGRLQDLGIPVFHDDQHGTAVVVLAAVTNALRLTGRKGSDVRAVINGAGSAGIAITNLLIHNSLKNITLCDKQGILHSGNAVNAEQRRLVGALNPGNRQGSLEDALVGADIFIGVSGPNCVTREMVAGMNANPIVFPLANPTPEIGPEDAKAGGAFVVGTGRSDYPNQINNALAFPGIFRGALDARAGQITAKMKIAAAQAIAGCVSDSQLSADYIMPSPLDRSVAKAVAKAVAEATGD
jgi:malate dehydrogenase (oxaloacetate-decarboxylating)